MPSNSVFLVPLVVILAASDYSRVKVSLRSNSIDSRADSIAVVGTASRFHDALRSGDIAEVKRLIASDLSVLEGGEVETRAQYLRGGNRGESGSGTIMARGIALRDSSELWCRDTGRSRPRLQEPALGKRCGRRSRCRNYERNPIRQVQPQISEQHLQSDFPAPFGSPRSRQAHRRMACAPAMMLGKP